MDTGAKGYSTLIQNSDTVIRLENMIKLYTQEGTMNTSLQTQIDIAMDELATQMSIYTSRIVHELVEASQNIPQ